MAVTLTQPLTEMTTRNLSGRTVDNLTAICKQIVYKMWYPRRLTTL
jgi:hypothetical protein